MKSQTVQHAGAASTRASFDRFVKGGSLGSLFAFLGDRLMVLLAWTLQAVLNAAIGCQFGKVAPICGGSFCEPVSVAGEASGRCVASAIFMLFESVANGVAWEPKGVKKRVVARMPRGSLPMLSRGWLSLPGSVAGQELFNAGRSPPRGA